MSPPCDRGHLPKELRLLLTLPPPGLRKWGRFHVLCLVQYLRRQLRSTWEAHLVSSGLEGTVRSILERGGSIQSANQKHLQGLPGNKGLRDL